MRRLTITNHHFDTFLYPFLMQSVAREPAEWDVALRLLRKLKDPAETEERELTPEEADARRRGIPVYPFRRLRQAEATLLLEEDEFTLLSGRLAERKSNVLLGAADDFAELLAAVANAPIVAPQLIAG